MKGRHGLSSASNPTAWKSAAFTFIHIKVHSRLPLEVSLGRPCTQRGSVSFRGSCHRFALHHLVRPLGRIGLEIRNLGWHLDVMTGSGDVRGSDFFVLTPADAEGLSIVFCLHVSDVVLLLLSLFLLAKPLTILRVLQVHFTIFSHGVAPCAFRSSDCNGCDQPTT